ncbi:MAG TPA: YIP1 family protein [Pyrinomonadaceae bacterium]
MSEALDNFQPPPPPSLPVAEVKAPRPTKLRVPAIVLFVVGLIVAGGGFAKFIPGGIGTGAALAFFGIVLVALSFIPLPVIDSAEEPMSPVSKLLGIFFEPSRVFKNLRVHPRWLAAFVTVVVLSSIYSFAFTKRVTPERIVNHTIDKLAEMGPPFAPPQERLDAMRTQQIEDAKNPVQRVGNVVKAFCGVFIFTAVIAALYMLACLAFGGRMNFWQSLAVMFYAAVPIITVQKLLGLVLLYLKAPEDIHPILGAETMVQDNLGVLVSPASHPVLFVLASTIGLLSFYSLWLKSTGLKNGATKVSSGTAWGVAITMWILGTLAIVGITALFPTFIS